MPAASPAEPQRHARLPPQIAPLVSTPEVLVGLRRIDVAAWDNWGFFLGTRPAAARSLALARGLGIYGIVAVDLDGGAAGTRLGCDGD